MKASVLLDYLRRVPWNADVLAKTADGRWLKIAAVEFTYNPSDGLANERPSNVCVDGPEAKQWR